MPWLGNTLQTADAALLVVDLSEPSCLEQLPALQAVLAGLRVTLSEHWEATAESPGRTARNDADPLSAGEPFVLRLPTLMLANKADGIAGVKTELQVLRDLTSLPFPAIAVSATTGRSLGEIGPWLFRNLGIVRVYTKVPGHAADKQRPFSLRRGQTVADVARLVHRDLGHSLRYARIWGQSGGDGQQVGHEHRLADGDSVELHA